MISGVFFGGGLFPFSSSPPPPPPKPKSSHVPSSIYAVNPSWSLHPLKLPLSSLQPIHPPSSPPITPHPQPSPITHHTPPPSLQPIHPPSSPSITHDPHPQPSPTSHTLTPAFPHHFLPSPNLSHPHSHSHSHSHSHPHPHQTPLHLSQPPPPDPSPVSKKRVFAHSRNIAREYIHVSLNPTFFSKKIKNALYCTHPSTHPLMSLRSIDLSQVKTFDKSDMGAWTRHGYLLVCIP